jgi:hypothetical protein
VADSEPDTVTYALADYREVSAIVGPLDAKSFVAGYRGHEHWRRTSLNPCHAVARLVERVQSFRSRRAG